MLGYILRRLAMTLPTLLIAVLMVFVLMRLIPGDPAIILVGDIQNTAELERVREKLGLDQPMPVQFGLWLWSLVRLDLGASLITGEPVLSGMLSRFAVTAQIVVTATVLASLIAVPAGMLAAWRQNRRTDAVLVTLSVLCLSVPSFWVGLMLLLVLGVQLQWLPVVGFVSVTDDLGAGLAYLVMPVLALIFVEVGTILRMARSTTIEVLRADYITHARAKGLSEGAVLSRHAFRNAFAPTLTLIGLILGSLLGGAAVIETVFTLPGLGRLLVDSIYARDYPMVQGIVLLVAFTYIVLNLLVDLVYPLLDPRVRL